MSEGMDLSNVIFGSKSLNIREELFDNLKDSEFDKGISNDLDFENLVKLTEKLSQHSLDIVKHIKNFSFDSIGLLEKILDHDKKSVTLRTEDDVRRDELIKKISVINEKTLDLTEDIKKEEKKLKREKKEALKELPDSSDVSVARESITGNAFTKSIKLKMFDLQKGFSDSVASIPFFGESLSEKFSPEDENQLKVEKFKKLDSEIEKKKSAATLAKGENKISLEKQIAEMESEKNSISDELGDSIKDLNKTDDKLASLEFDKLLHETNSQNEILEEIKTLLGEDIGDELKLELQEKASLIEKEKNNKIDELIKLQDQQSQTLSQEKSAELQEEEVARAEERTWMQSLFESLTGEESDSDKSGKEKKKGGLFGGLFGGITGLFGKDGTISKFKNFFGEGGGFETKMTAIKGLSASISTFFTSLASSLSAFITPLLPVIGIVAGIALVAYSIYEAFQEMSAVYESTGSIVETLKAGISRFIGTIVGLPFDLLKGIVSYVADWLGFEDFSNWLDSFSFTDIFTEAYSNLLDWLEYAIVGIFDVIKIPFVWLNNLIKDTFGIDAFGLYVEYLKAIWNGLTFPFRFLFNLVKWDVILEDILYSWQSVKTSFSDFWSSMKEWVSEKWEGLKTDMGNAWESFKTCFIGLWSGLSGWFSEKWTGLKTSFGEMWEKTKEKFGLNEIFDKLSEFWNWYKGIWVGMFDKVKGVFNSLKDKMSSFMGLLSGIGIPEMTIFEGNRFLNPIKFGPWYPFREDIKEGETKVSASQKNRTRQKGDLEIQEYESGTVTMEKDKTSFYYQERKTESDKDGYENDYSDFYAEHDLKTGKRIMQFNNDGKVEYAENLSNSAFMKIKEGVENQTIDSKQIKAIIEEDKAYNDERLTFFDRRKVDVGYTTAVEILKSIENKEKVAKSIQTDQSKNVSISNTLDSVQTDSNNIKLEKENKKSVENSSGDSFSSVNQNNSRKYVSTNNYAHNKKIFSSQ